MDNLDLVRKLKKYPVMLGNYGEIHCNLNNCDYDEDSVFLEDIPSREFDLELFIDALVSHIRIYHPEWLNS